MFLNFYLTKDYKNELCRKLQKIKPNQTQPTAPVFTPKTNITPEKICQKKPVFRQITKISVLNFVNLRKKLEFWLV